MKRIINLGLFITVLFYLSCQKQNETNVIEGNALEYTPQAIRITLAVAEDSPEELMLSNDGGLKSSALSFVTELNVGDTIFWQLNDHSNIKSIKRIIIVDSDCEEEVFVNGINFYNDATVCYGVVSPNAFGNIKYDIEFEFLDGRIIRVDPRIRIKQIEPPPRT